MEATNVKRVSERRMNVAEIKRLKWISGLTRNGKIRNKQIKGTNQRGRFGVEKIAIGRTKMSTL